MVWPSTQSSADWPSPAPASACWSPCPRRWSCSCSVALSSTWALRRGRGTPTSPLFGSTATLWSFWRSSNGSKQLSNGSNCHWHTCPGESLSLRSQFAEWLSTSLYLFSRELPLCHQGFLIIKHRILHIIKLLHAASHEIHLIHSSTHPQISSNVVQLGVQLYKSVLCRLTEILKEEVWHKRNIEFNRNYQQIIKD